MSQTKEVKKLNLKEKLNDDTLDLSLCDLETIPVKEIAEMTKVKKLNLSYNKLTSLPDDFCKLQHIKEIDLSKNQLRSLPKNFGFLNSLKTLDLLGNKLTTLPSSFGDLKSLQWLDLKDNPLNPDLKKAAGDCLDEAQCKKCAVNVLKLMKQIAAEEERRRQIQLEKQRKEQLKREAEENEKAEQLRLQKKQEKELRRRELNERKAEIRSQKGESESDKDQWYNKPFKSTDQSQLESKKSGFFGKLFVFLVRLVLYSVFLVLLFLVINNYCQISKDTKVKSSTFNYPFLKPAYEFVDVNVCPHVLKTDILKHPVVNELLKKWKLIASSLNPASKN